MLVTQIEAYIKESGWVMKSNIDIHTIMAR